MGHTVGVVGAGDGNIADDHALAVGGADNRAVLVDAHLFHLAGLHVGHRVLCGVLPHRDCTFSINSRANCGRGAIPFCPALVKIGLGILVQPVSGGQIGVNRIALLPLLHRNVLPVRVLFRSHAAVILRRGCGLKGNPQGNQMGADNGLALNVDALGLLRGDILLRGVGHIIGVLHPGKAVDNHAVAVADIAVRVHHKVAHPGQGVVLQLVAAGDAAAPLNAGNRPIVSIGLFLFQLAAQQIEALTIDIAVQAHAGGGVGGGGHIQVDGGHCTAVTDLGGIVAAVGHAAVGAGAGGAVDGLLERHTLGLIAVGVDVGNVVADDVQFAHVGSQAANGGVHCACH